MGEAEIHPFKPFIPDKATVLIVGSFPGKEQTTGEKNDNHMLYIKLN